MRTKLIIAGTTLATTLATTLSLASTLSAASLGGSARTPPLGDAQHGTVDYMERVVTWPATARPNGNTLSFDYLVDSERGHDVLRVYVGGVEQDLFPHSAATGVSGLNRAGRAVVRVPQSGGSFTVRFAYHKDAAGTHGRDLAVVDDLFFSSAAVGGPFARHRFDDDISLTDAGWVTGGDNGGFVAGGPERERAAVRPREQAWVDGSLSYMQRTITLPPCWGCGARFRGAVEFDYYVDSEVGGDWLRVRVDGVQQDLDHTRPLVQGITGRNRAGTRRIRLPGPGAHTVRFEYVKNGSVSVGRDTARVDQVRVLDGDGALIEFHDFSGRDPNVSPIRCTASGAPNVPVEWQGGSTGLGDDGLGWSPRAESPPVAYVPLQTAGERLKPSYRIFDLPAAMVDGLVSAGHYDNATEARLFDFRSLTLSGQLRMVADAGSGDLFLGLTGASGSPLEQGNERARLFLYLDGKRSNTLRDRVTAGVASCADVASPGPEDRRIRLTYTIPAGSSEPVAPAVREWKGDCAGWVPLAGSPSWLAAASVREVAPGRIDAEIRLDFPAESAVDDDGALGLGLRFYKQAAAPGPGTEVVDERWPDGRYGVPTADVNTYATIQLSVPRIARYYHRAENPFRGVLTPNSDPYHFPLLWGR